MARRIPLIGDLPGPARLGVWYLLAFIPIGAIFWWGLMEENIGLFIAGVFGLSFWLLSLLFVGGAMIIKAIQSRRNFK